MHLEKPMHMYCTSMSIPSLRSVPNVTFELKCTFGNGMYSLEYGVLQE